MKASWWAGVAHVWLGVSYILPFHAILFSVDVLGSSSMFAFTVAYFGPCMVACFMLAAIPRQLSSVPPRARIVVSYALFAVALLFFAALLQDERAPLWLYGVVVCSVGILDGFAQSTVIGFASAGSQERVRQVLLGNAVAGVAVAALKVVVKASLLQNTRLASTVFFGICAALMLGTIGVHWSVSHPDETACEMESAPGSRSLGMMTLGEMSPHALLIFLCFFSTLTIYPGVASEFSSSVIPKTWISVLMLSSFNAGDLAGRSLVGSERMGRPLLRDWRVNGACVAARVVMLAPLFVLALPAVGVIRFELVPLAALFLFGLTGGFLASLNMTAATELARDKQLAGAVLTFVALLGLFGGSLAAFGIGLAIA